MSQTRHLTAWLVRLWRGSQAVTEMADYPLPLYMRRSAGLAPTALTAADKAAAKALLADPGTDNPPKHNA